jgi:hypothetical protein
MEIEKQHRILIAVILAFGVIFQLIAISAAQHYGSDMKFHFECLGATLPLVTRLFFASYRLWWFIPIIGVGISIDLLRRSSPPWQYVLLGTLYNICCAFILIYWTNAAFVTPFILLASGTKIV